MAKPKTLTAAQKKKNQQMDLEMTKLQCLEVDLEAPLSSADWEQVAFVVSEIQAMVWFQVLPANQKSSMPFQFNCMHVLPSEKIMVERLPIERMIAQKMKFYRKNEKQQRNMKSSKNAIKVHIPVHERDPEATEIDLILLDEFEFPHAIMTIKPEQVSRDELNYTYKKICAFLGLHTNQDTGITVIVTPQWMFVGVIHQPYHIEPEIKAPSGEDEDVERHELTLFLDGFAYAGVVNLQQVNKVWPATADGTDCSHTVIGALTKQSTEPEMF